MLLAIAIGLTLLNAVLLLTVLVGLPGTWLMLVATLMVAWWRWNPEGAEGGQMFSPAVLITLVGIALLGELLEVVAGLVGSKKFGGSNRSALGALVGTLAGGVVGTFAIPIPLFGSLVGACIGAAAGAWGVELHDGRPMGDALKSGTGAGVGRFMGTVGKLSCGVIMWIVAAVAAFWQ